MRTVVIGAGPVGLFCGMTLARSGHQVLVVDRDPPPPPFGVWHRRGVMQFNLPHFFRPIVRQVILGSWPELWEQLVAAGGIPAVPDGLPEELTGLQCRRSTFEQVTWSAAAREPGLVLHTGHVDRVVVERGRAAGVVVDGAQVDADVVIVAAGRAGRVADDYRQPGEGGSCGFSYAARMYRARDGVEPPSSALPMSALYRGYLALVFPQDDRTLSALIVRPTAAHHLAPLRRVDCFEAAAREIPLLGPWTGPAEFEPITDVLAGSGLSNTYRGQLDSHAAASGLFFVGDAVCTTNPAAGRGVSLGLRQAAELTTLLNARDGRRDYVGVSRQFEWWCAENIRPWYDDHVYWDATLLARLRGEDIDLDARIPSDVICAAAQVDPSIWRLAGPYMGMQVPPGALRAVEDQARTVLRTGGDLRLRKARAAKNSVRSWWERWALFRSQIKAQASWASRAKGGHYPPDSASRIRRARVPGPPPAHTLRVPAGRDYLPLPPGADAALSPCRRERQTRPGLPPAPRANGSSPTMSCHGTRSRPNPGRSHRLSTHPARRPPLRWRGATPAHAPGAS
jgi:2-polyprenyl-6-methoxyphenol hydroxylase-like FAD-dependent oxidoreductase